MRYTGVGVHFLFSVFADSVFLRRLGRCQIFTVFSNSSTMAMIRGYSLFEMSLIAISSILQSLRNCPCKLFMTLAANDERECVLFLCLDLCGDWIWSSHGVKRFCCTLREKMFLNPSGFWSNFVSFINFSDFGLKRFLFLTCCILRNIIVSLQTFRWTGGKRSWNLSPTCCISASYQSFGVFGLLLMRVWVILIFGWSSGWRQVILLYAPSALYSSDFQIINFVFRNRFKIWSIRLSYFWEFGLCRSTVLAVRQEGSVGKLRIDQDDSDNTRLFDTLRLSRLLNTFCDNCGVYKKVARLKQYLSSQTLC